jgi:hypothetical protein
MDKILTEENGNYVLDCHNTLWATDELHNVYHESGIHDLNDVDWVLENETHLLMVEYKNANIDGAVNPGAFNPEEDKKVSTIVRKFYDSLHYLSLIDKTKPKQFIYILEYPNGDYVSRKRLRNRLKTQLPFSLQENIGNGKTLIEKISVLSIEEWNSDEVYKDFPLRKSSMKR